MSTKHSISYPEIYSSDKIGHILSSSPTLPLEPIKPKEPEKPKDPCEYDSGGERGCFGFMLFGSIAAFFWIMNSHIDNKLGLLSHLVIMILLSFFLFKTTTYDKKSHKGKKDKYINDIKFYPTFVQQYQKELKEYNIKMQAYKSTIEEMLSTHSLKKYRSSLVLSYLYTRTHPQLMPYSNSDNIRIGVSEYFFRDLLESNGFNICFNKKIKVGNHFFYPDILIEQQGLLIDIEIDEPYIESDGTPIHFVDQYLTSVDNDRNTFFTQQGFEVIRFAEEQIFLHPNRCIGVIKEYIEQTLSGNEYFVSNNDDFCIKKWTSEDASKLAYRRFRRTYIPAEYLKYIDNEDEKTYTQLVQEIRHSTNPNQKFSINNHELVPDDLPF